MINTGDNFILDYSNGLTYLVKVISINDFRGPDMKYGIEVYDKNGLSGEIRFVSESFLNNCEKIS